MIAAAASGPWFFDDAEAVQRLLATRDLWAGTPFARNSRARGPHGGIDCVGYVEECMHGAGLPRLDFPRSELDYSVHVLDDKILRYLRGLHEDPQSERLAAIFAEFPVKEHRFEAAAAAALGLETFERFTVPPMVGDLLIIKDEGRFGRGNGVFHMPIMMGPRKFTHCAPEIGGTQEGMIQDAFVKRMLVAHFRARASF